MGYGGDPSASPIDAVRFLIGDTDNDNLYLTDGEIQFLLNQYGGNAGRAAIDAVYGIISRLTAFADESVGSVSLSNNETLKGFQTLLGLLKSKYASTAPVRAWAGGISRAAKLAVRQNSDRVRPSFSRSDPSNVSSWQDGQSPSTPGLVNPKTIGDWDYDP